MSQSHGPSRSSRALISPGPPLPPVEWPSPSLLIPIYLCCRQGGIISQCTELSMIDTNRPLIVFNRQELLSLPSLPLGFQVISAFCCVSGPCLLTIDATFSLADHLILRNAGTLLAAWKIYC